MHDSILKSIAVQGAILQFVAIGIDGVNRVVQHLCYAGALLYPEPHESYDSEIGIELFPLAQDYLLLRPEQLIDLSHKIGIDMEECIIKHIIEFAGLLLDELTLFGQLKQVIDLAGRNLPVDHLVELIQLVHIYMEHKLRNWEI